MASARRPNRTAARTAARTDHAEGTVQIVMMLAIGGAAGAASFTHVHNVAAAHGQPGWLAWADAIVLELMSIAAGLELRRRKRTNTPIRFPAVVLGCAVTLSLAAQVVEAEPSPIGWIAAAVPALGFLVMVKIALSHTTTRPPDQSHQPTPSADRPYNLSSTPADRTTAMSSNRPAEPTTDRHHDSRTGRGPGTGSPRERSTSNADLRALLPAARTVRTQVAADGRALTRGTLAHRLRAAGHTVSNTKVSTLLKILKAELDQQPADSQNTPHTTPPNRPVPYTAVPDSPTAAATHQLGGSTSPTHPDAIKAPRADLLEPANDGHSTQEGSHTS